MKDQKKELEKKRGHFTALLGRTLDPAKRPPLEEKVRALDAELRALVQEEVPAPAPVSDASLSVHDSRPLDALPTQQDAQTLYVAPTAALAAELDAAGYPALWLDPLAADAALYLAGFTGTDIVLAHPELHPLASGLSAERFTVITVNCWPKGTLRALETVPVSTHILTLAERHDVIPIQSSSKGKLAQKLYKAFELDNTAAYRKMAREVVSA